MNVSDLIQVVQHDHLVLMRQILVVVSDASEKMDKGKQRQKEEH